MEENVPTICRSVTMFFGPLADRLGKALGFVRRRSKLTPELFVETLVLSSYIQPDSTLEQMCQLLREKGVHITKQGLHERFTPQATELMAQLFKEALTVFKGTCLGGIELLSSFSSVQPMDSTNVSLPESMASLYQGCGGDASEAALKLQVLFNYTEGCLEEVKITNGNKNDQSYKEHLANLKKGALYLQDLGYFSKSSFKKIHEAEAHFISRYLPQTNIYDEGGTRIDLIKMLEAAKGPVSFDARLGKEEQVPIRFIASPLSEKEVKKRHAKAVRKQRKISSEMLELMKWSIYITNVDRCRLGDEQVHLVYGLRWQVELFFKLCKSEAGIKQINSRKSDRVLCEMYAKLISVVQLMYLCESIRWQDDQEISWRRAYKQLRQCAGTFSKALKSPYRLLRFLKEFLCSLKRLALKDKKVKRPATYRKLMLATGQEALI